MHDAANGMNEAAEAHRDEYEGMRGEGEAAAENTDGQAAEPYRNPDMEPSPVPLHLLLGQFLNGPSEADKRAHDHKVAEHLFTYHSPTPDQLPRYHAIREAGKAMAHVIIDNAPSGPDRSVALRSIREAVMNANSAIANQEAKPNETPADAPDTQPAG